MIFISRDHHILHILRNAGQDSGKFRWHHGNQVKYCNASQKTLRDNVFSCSDSSSSSEVQPTACHVRAEEHHPDFCSKKIATFVHGNIPPHTCCSNCRRPPEQFSTSCLQLQPLLTAGFDQGLCNSVWIHMQFLIHADNTSDVARVKRCSSPSAGLSTNIIQQIPT